jgi:hypothetical protein
MSKSLPLWQSLPRRAFWKARNTLLHAEFKARQRRYNTRPHQDAHPEPVFHHIPRVGETASLPPALPVRSYGFAPHEKERDWSDLAVHAGDPGCLHGEDLLYLPGGHDWKKSGLYHADGRVVEDTLLRHGGNRMNGFDTVQVSRADLAVEEREVIYIGYVHFFGHFISEVLALLRVHDTLERPEEALWLFHGTNPASTGWGRQFLEAVGIRPEQMIRFERPTLLKRVIVPRQAILLNNSIWSAATNFTVAVGGRAMGTKGIKRTDRPLYLSRSRMHISQRRLGNEEALERWLESRGALIFHPQEHPLSDQIRTVNAHRTVIGSFGSAHFLGLFSAAPTRNVYFSSILAPATYMLIDNVKGSESVWIRSEELPSLLKPNPPMNLQNVIIDLPFTKKVLQDLGV